MAVLLPLWAPMRPSKSKAGLYAAIRRDHRAGMSMRALERKCGVTWQALRKALDLVWPEPRKKLPPRPTRLDPYKPLRRDLDAPPKRRHTVERVFDRLLDEYAATGISYQMVHGHIATRRGEIRQEAGRGPSEVFVPQTHLPGTETEVDFGDVHIMLAGVVTWCYLFCLRLTYSGKAVPRMFASFQVLPEREEKNSVAIASNESFGGWTKTFSDPRLCRAIVDRLTFKAAIIETGTDSYRLARPKTEPNGQPQSDPYLRRFPPGNALQQPASELLSAFGQGMHRGTCARDQLCSRTVRGLRSMSMLAGVILEVYHGGR